MRNNKIININFNLDKQSDRELVEFIESIKQRLNNEFTEVSYTRIIKMGITLLKQKLERQSNEVSTDNN